MESNKDNKVVLITGATGGLGQELTAQFLQQGYRVFLVARNADKLQALQKQYAQNYVDKVAIAVADFSKLSSSMVEGVFTACVEKWQAPDILVNNAGITGGVGKSYELSFHEYTDAFQVNLFAAIELCRVCVPAMVAKGHGKIIQISGGGATGPRENFSPYALSKTALVRYTENLSRELDELRPGVQIDVNAIAPGAMKTAMTEEILQMGKDTVGEKEFSGLSKKLQTAPTPPAVAAELCLFLASSASDGISGRLLSAVWDKWQDLPKVLDELRTSDIYTLRRVIGKDRGKEWDK
ncbi:MAG: SDR family oxidoreductase [Spirochaetota bacterium]